LNHPLIDRIKITDEYSGFGNEDKKLMNECDFICSATANHDIKDWYNYRDCVTETARLAGINDMTEVLTSNEMKPKLIPWFSPGFENPSITTYSKKNIVDLSHFKKSVGIWPFTGQTISGRSPSSQWWNALIEKLTNEDYTVFHFGRMAEPTLSNAEGYYRAFSLSFFQQVKAALATNITIGPDTGPMWVMGAYSHPSINLVTNYLPGHKSNLLALNPINDKAVTFFEKGGCDNIKVEEVVDNIRQRIEINKEEK
jgi:ADP-heptose:LPS heptosyltransferase